jgi:hypothetical protein
MEEHFKLQKITNPFFAPKVVPTRDMLLNDLATPYFFIKTTIA